MAARGWRWKRQLTADCEGNRTHLRLSCVRFRSLNLQAEPTLKAFNKRFRVVCELISCGLGRAP